MATRSLVVLPDDSATPIVDAICHAERSIRVKMFVFSDPGLIDAILAAKQRGIEVRVMLNPARRNGKSENDATRALLVAAGIDVADSNPAFAVTHEKSMVVDDEIAFVKSLNWETRNLTETRDFAIVTTHEAEVREIAAGFDADWNRQPFDPGPNARLLWCPGNGRARICELIDNAKHTLFAQNERYQDSVVIERLVRAARRGVKVHVMVNAPHTLKMDKLVEGIGGLRILDDVGVKVRKLKHMRLHSKIMLADGVVGIVGSMNLAPGSFDDRRELAIEIHNDDAIERLNDVARHDWENSHPIDLSDAGLLADIRDRKEAASLLVLDS
jgi:cardiolipin synthase